MKLLFVCIFFFGTLSSSEIDEVLYVSLGGCCEVASQLRHHHLRNDAYPFDWLITSSHDKFVQLLNDDFKYFLDENCMIRNTEYPAILDNHFYECEFRHDQSVNPTESIASHIQEILSKYERRITRFRHIREFGGKVFFIRCPYDSQNGGPYFSWREDQERITPEQSVELKATLNQYFPGVDFTLVIVNYVQENVGQFNDLEGIIEFKIDRGCRAYDYARLFDLLRNRL